MHFLRTINILFLFTLAAVLLGATPLKNATWTTLKIDGNKKDMQESLDSLEFLRTQVVLDKPTLKTNAAGEFLSIFLHADELICDSITVRGERKPKCDHAEMVHLRSYACKKTDSKLRIKTTWQLCYEEEQIKPKTLRIKTNYRI